MLLSCGPGHNKARVQGGFKHVQNAELYFYSADGQTEGIDTVIIKNGSFKADINVSEPSLYTLLLQNFTEYSLILEPGAVISIGGDAQKLAEMDISGTDDNELLSQFRQETAGKSESDCYRAASDFIRSHAESMAAVAVLRDVFGRREQPPAQYVTPLLEVLRRAQPKSRAFQFVEQSLRPRLTSIVGQPLPVFSATTLDGEHISSETFRETPLLIAFVATWTNRYNEYMRALSMLGNGTSNNLKVLLVSLDTDVERLRTRLKTDTLGFPVVCDGKAFASPVAKTLGVRYVPGNLLVGSDGRVKARDVDPANLPDEIKKLR